MTLSYRSFAILVCVFVTIAFGGCADTPTQDVNIAFENGNTAYLDNGQSITITAAVSNNNGEGVTFSCSGACSGSNLSAINSVSVKFTATTVGTATIKATAVQKQSFSRTMTITVTNPPALPGGALAAATRGAVYNATVSESGGAGTLTYSITSGALPAGLSINSNSGAITGTPTGTTTGQINFTVTVKDSGNPPLSTSAQYSITVGVPVGALQIATASPLPPGSIGAAYTAIITATGGTSPYSFSIDASGTQLPTGLSITNSNNQGIIAGTPTIGGTFTNILVDVHDSTAPTADTAQTAFSLTISAAPLIITPGNGALPNATVGTAYSESITVTGGIAPYTFTLDSGSAALPAGLTFSATGTGATISGMPTAAGTTTGIIVDVKDSSPGAIAVQITYSLEVTPACDSSGDESLLSGQYAMLVKGFDSGGQPVTMGAVLYIDGEGTVDAGVFDMNTSTTHGVAENSVTGSYAIGSDQRGCMSLTTSAGSVNFRITAANINSGVASTVHMVESDAAGPFSSGAMLLQDTTAFSTAAVNGNYALGIASPQNTAAGGGKLAAAGVVSISSAGAVTGGELDYSDAGALDNSAAASWTSATPLTISSGGTVFVDSANGLGNLIFTVTINSVATNISLQMYVVNADEFLIMSGADQTVAGNLFGAGVALKQTNATFAGSSLNGTSVLHYSAENSSNAATTAIGLLTTNGSGSLTLAGWQNNGTAIQAASDTGTVSVAANGRVTFSSGGGTNPAVLWLVGSNEGFWLGADASVTSGFFEPQTATTVTTGTPYAFGSVDPELSGTDQLVGVATFDGTDVSGTTDGNQSGAVTKDQAFGPFTYSVDGTGFGSIPNGCTVGNTGATGCTQIFYVITPTKGVWMNLLNGSGSVKGTPNEIANQ